MAERILLSPNGKTCWKATLRGRTYTISSGPVSAPKLRGSNTVASKAEAQRRVDGLEAHMRVKGYRGPEERPKSPKEAQLPSLPRFVKTTRLAAAKRTAAALTRGFKPTKESSLAQLASLAVVVYGHRRDDDLTALASFAAALGAQVHPSHGYCLQEIFALESRACRDRGKASQCRKWRTLIRDLGFNEFILSRDHVEHHHDFGLHDHGPMTVGQETKWRMKMVKVLALATELGGSRSLTAQDASRELDEHLAHLRAIWKVKQKAVPERPTGRRGPYPIHSVLFPR